MFSTMRTYVVIPDVLEDALLNERSTSISNYVIMQLTNVSHQYLKIILTYIFHVMYHMNYNVLAMFQY